MSETPRTDAEFKLEAFFDGTGIVETVLVEFAQELESELADKDRQLAEMRAEIERKDKLIEQMREALKAIDGIGREAGNARREDALRCFAIAAAALAAEGGE